MLVSYTWNLPTLFQVWIRKRNTHVHSQNQFGACSKLHTVSFWMDIHTRTYLGLSCIHRNFPTFPNPIFPLILPWSALYQRHKNKCCVYMHLYVYIFYHQYNTEPNFTYYRQLWALDIQISNIRSFSKTLRGVEVYTNQTLKFWQIFTFKLWHDTKKTYKPQPVKFSVTTNCFPTATTRDFVRTLKW